MLKNRLFVLIIALFMALPVFAVNEDGQFATSEIQETTATDTFNVANQTIPELNFDSKSDKSISQKTFKQPIGKRKIIKRFLLAMFGVLASSLAIFIGLSIYNKIRTMLKTSLSENVFENCENSLETPDNITSAVRSFVEKTQWDE